MTLLRDLAGEFKKYSEIGHASVIASWQSQFEMWVDTVLDLQDAQALGNGPAPWSGGNGIQDGGRPGWGAQEMPGHSMDNAP